jgi:ABC-type multidrug transport system ATPase subunit
MVSLYPLLKIPTSSTKLVIAARTWPSRVWLHITPTADHTEAKAFRHQMLFNSEEDIHFPTLTVAQTMHFALRNKAPDNMPAHLCSKDAFAKHLGDDILEQLGISHTESTFVGNEYIRGVSGGERKRVSVAEVMAGQVRISIIESSILNS